MIRLPPPLRPGSRIGVFAPSGIFDPVRLEQGFALLRSWGYEPVPAPNLGAKHRFLAGTDAERLADLRWALYDPGLDAAWMARGGYGLLRLLDGVSWDAIPSRPIIGFSDGTLLHVALRQRAGLAGIHGPVLHSLADLADDASREHLRAMLAGSRRASLQGRALLPGEAEGPLVGGNLCSLASLCGTPWALDARGCVVALEDIAEPPYKIDRMLRQLRVAGAFEGVLGFAIGELTGTRTPEGADWDMDAVWRDALGDLGVPILIDLPIGHGQRNAAFLNGYTARFEGDRLCWGRL